MTIIKKLSFFITQGIFRPAQFKSLSHEPDGHPIPNSRELILSSTYKPSYPHAPNKSMGVASEGTKLLC